MKKSARNGKWHQLTDIFCRQVAARGKYRDSPNLILRVDDAGNKSFGFRYDLDGREHTLGLGPYPAISLKRAREIAADLRAKLKEGIDPKAVRSQERAERQAAAARLITFREAERKLYSEREGVWTNEQHRRDWRNAMNRHVLPVIGALPVGAIDTAAVLTVLERDGFWRLRPTTADRCRARIEDVLDWAVPRGYRTAVPNPATWAGNLDAVLIAPSKLKPVKHHPALPYADIGTFMADLRAREGLAARALEFTILTAARVGMTLKTTCDEFDFKARTWTLPASKMKKRKSHVVPLSPRALAIACELIAAAGEDRRVFPTHRATVGKLLRVDMGRSITTHGFRSCFTDWAAETTAFPEDVRSAALAHKIKDSTWAAYQRGALLEKRRKLMDAWDRVCRRTASTASALKMAA